MDFCIVGRLVKLRESLVEWSNCGLHPFRTLAGSGLATEGDCNSVIRHLLSSILVFFAKHDIN